MGRVPRLTTSALLAAAVVIGILDPHNAHTALVAAAIPTVVHAATKKQDTRLIWTVNAAFTVGMLISDPHVAMLAVAVPLIAADSQIHD